MFQNQNFNQPVYQNINNSDYIVYEEWRDPYIGYQFESKYDSDLIECVRQTIEERGKQYVIMESGSKYAVDELHKLFNFKGVDENRLKKRELFIQGKEVVSNDDTTISDSSNIPLLLDDEKDELSTSNNIDINTSKQNIAANKSVEQLKRSSNDNAIFKKIKTQKTLITVTYELDLPSKDLFNVLKDNLDNFEEDFYSYFLDTLNLEQLKKILKSKIKEYYSIDNM